MTATLRGQKFGRLTVLYRLRIVATTVTFAVCECECGKVTKVRQSQLNRGGTRSCGCLKRDTTRARAKTHGKTRSRTWNTWRGMIERCTNPRHRDFGIYGGRGIAVCERWRAFSNFYADMGERPEGMTLNGFPNKDGNYQPGNCRWATTLQQTRNKRSSVVIEHGGRRMVLVDWTRELGISPHGLYNKIKVLGWSAERALRLPGARIVEGGP